MELTFATRINPNDPADIDTITVQHVITKSDMIDYALDVFKGNVEAVQEWLESKHQDFYMAQESNRLQEMKN